MFTAGTPTSGTSTRTTTTSGSASPTGAQPLRRTRSSHWSKWASSLARRTGYMLLILTISSIVIFYALRSAPGGPSGGGVINPLASQEIRQAYDKRLGLDQPVYTQYFIYLKHLVTGDLGAS